MKRWYVVHTQSYQEPRAELNLRHQGFEVWLPLTRRTRRHARRIDTISCAAFSSLPLCSAGSKQPNLAIH